MEVEAKKVYKKRKTNLLYLSIWFLVFTILLTTWIYSYNLYLTKSNIQIDLEKDIKDLSIKEIEKDPKIILSSLYKSNMSSINKLTDYSSITTFISHVSLIWKKYWIKFNGFKYNSWKLSLWVTSSSDLSWGINYKKAADFISEYRLNVDKQAIFDLDFIKTISTKNDWVDNEFNINLVLKNNLTKIIEVAKKEKDIEVKKQKEEDNRKKEEIRKKREALLKKKEETENNSKIN